ncbi:serine protease 1-like [Drosophila subobscura]|uniref:serine protease 1-like n=1 Tax=Drosophila subobscura TaxID=7241 RepID=UPI00155A0A73|nr:serine protease 1-like [Drosophila subobscura]
MLIFLCLLLVPHFVAGEENVVQRIVNGKLAKNRQFPYVVHLKVSKNNNDTRGCGGSIIANTWVLTAAHCTENATWVSLNYGDIWRGDKPAMKLLVKDHVFPHPQYNSRYNGFNDIALIRTERVEFSVHIQSIPLPTESRDGHNDYVGQWATVAGWGDLHDRGNGSVRLFWASLQVVDQSECRYRYGKDMRGVLCARSDSEQSVCGGDSGGPLVHNKKKELIGVVSFGSLSGCEEGGPLGFMDVSKYVAWIRHVSGVGAKNLQ